MKDDIINNRDGLLYEEMKLSNDMAAVFPADEAMRRAVVLAGGGGAAVAAISPARIHIGVLTSGSLIAFAVIWYLRYQGNKVLAARRRELRGMLGLAGVRSKLLNQKNDAGKAKD